MRRPGKSASLRVKAGALLALGIVLTIASVKGRRRAMPRRDPSRRYEDFQLVTEDGITLSVRSIPGGRKGAVIIAHPAVTGQRFSPLVDLAECMAAHFDVYTFDFRGHGRSGGWTELNLLGPLEDMRTVVSHVRSRGYPFLGAVGFSLGGMTAFVYNTARGGLDAVAMVGAPPRLPDAKPYRRWLPLWSLWLRSFGARFKAINHGGPQPLEAASRFPDAPLLVVHGEYEPFYSREDLRLLMENLGGHGELWVIDGAGHTELKGREQDLVEWMVKAASCHNR